MKALFSSSLKKKVVVVGVSLAALAWVAPRAIATPCPSSGTCPIGPSPSTPSSSALKLIYEFVSDASSSTVQQPFGTYVGTGMTALAELFFERSGSNVNIYGTFKNTSGFQSYVTGFGFRGNMLDANYTVGEGGSFDNLTPFNPSLSSFSDVKGSAPLSSTNAWSFRADSNGQSGNTGALGSVSDDQWPYAFYFDAPEGKDAPPGGPSAVGIGQGQLTSFSLTYTGSEDAQTLYDYFSRGQGFFRAQSIDADGNGSVDSDPFGSDKVLTKADPTAVPLESDLAGILTISGLAYWTYRRSRGKSEAELQLE